MVLTLSAVVAAWLLAGIFALAVRHKLRSGIRFQATLAAYRLVPPKLIKTAALLIIAAEAAAVLLLLGLQPAGAVLAGLLLSGYAAAICLNLMRGRDFIDCGCGDSPTAISPLLLLRNGVLLFLCTWPLWSAAGLASLSGSALAVAGGLALGWLIMYESAEQLLANRGVHRRLWQSGLEGA